MTCVIMYGYSDEGFAICIMHLWESYGNGSALDGVIYPVLITGNCEVEQWIVLSISMEAGIGEYYDSSRLFFPLGQMTGSF
jgi:hypothetical protein